MFVGGRNRVWRLTSLSTNFQLYFGGQSLIGGENRSALRENHPPAARADFGYPT